MKANNMLSLSNIQKKSRNQSIDLVKIIAMFMVMALHTFIGKTQTLFISCLSIMSGIAIPLFFMVSGFLMWNRNVDYKYALKKIFGIVRFVAIICLMYYIIFILPKGFDYIDFLKLFFGSFVQRSYMPVFWYFGAMCLIYALLPAIYRFGLRNNNLPIYSFLILMCIVFVTFILNITIKFEKSYILQTFRIWNWLFYFMIGCFFKSIYTERGTFFSMETRKHCFFALPIVIIAYIIFVKITKTYLLGIEYYFGSTLCWIYATLVFILCLTLKIQDNKFITMMSKCFLPVYAIHEIVIRHIVNKLHFVDYFGEYYPIFDYILVVSISILLSLAIMKLPYSNKIFKI